MSAADPSGRPFKRRESAAAYYLGLWLRIPLGVRMSFPCECLCCQVEVSATGWSLVQRSPTKCGLSEFDLETSTMKRPRPTRDVQEWYIYIYDIIYHHLFKQLELIKEFTKLISSGRPWFIGNSNHTDLLERRIIYVLWIPLMLAPHTKIRTNTNTSYVYKKLQWISR